MEARETDFNIVKRQIIREYLKLNGNDGQGRTWSLEACLDVFRYYYRRYKQIFDVDHPNLSDRTIGQIIEALPYANRPDYSDEIDLLPEDYPALIEAYFYQEFDRCNYSIAHFMSGDIRALRYYEALY